MSTTLDPRHYIEYFKWNDELIDHFFHKRHTEIRLYADENILREVGEKVGIESEDYKSLFYSSVERFCGNYCNVHKITRNGNTDVLAVAHHLLTSTQKFYQRYIDANGVFRVFQKDGKAVVQDLPYFSIIIYVILKFDEGETQEWRNVSLVTTNSRPYIKELWEGLHNWDNRFNKDASVFDRQDSTYDDYVGRILYHLPLSSSIRHKIEDAIYKSSAWKVVDHKSFEGLIAHISRSLRPRKENEELNKILLTYCLSKDHREIYARKVQTVIDNFDIDLYEEKIADRKNVGYYNDTLICGSFALALYFPNNSDEDESNIVLLTTIQHPIEAKECTIERGSSGTIAGYNTSFIKKWDNQPIKLQEYSISKSRLPYRINHIGFGDVLFFYQYDESLYIQTDRLIPSKAYIIAVKDEKVGDFKTWCDKNNNTVEGWPKDDTKELFGNDWSIFYTEERLIGDFYDNAHSEDSTCEEAGCVIMRGGIPFNRSHDTYFINALPYFEIPNNIDIKKVKVYLNLDGQLYSDYNIIIVDRKIILDFEDIPFGSDEKAYIDVCLGVDNKIISQSYSFAVCGQKITYDYERLYKFNDFGLLENSEKFSYAGNKVYHNPSRKNPHRGYAIKTVELNDIVPDFYFVNLIAASCYSNQDCEISHDRFRKCVSYASSRLKIDIQQEDFISNTKRLMSYAGILNLNYNTGKCQAIPPLFTRTPFSRIGTASGQLIMLSGCYTRAFIADLLDYCNDRSIGIYALNRDHDLKHKNEELLLPPIILLDHNFNANDFSQEYSHNCDVLCNEDFALNIVDLIPRLDNIKGKFKFENTSSTQFLSQLDQTRERSLPRLRTIRVNSVKKNWYIETTNSLFAEIPEGYVTWASLWCHHKKESPMAIINRDYSIYIPESVWIPSYIQRALYLMNPGLPKTEKVFVCNCSNENYYQVMKTYQLHSDERCKEFTSKFIGDETASNTLIRLNTANKIKLELWKSKINGNKHRDWYLIAFDDTMRNGILAIIHKKSIYLNCGCHFNKVASDSFNEGLSFILKEKWNFGTGKKSIGFSRQGGTDYQKKYDIIEDSIELPSSDKFNKETIKVVL